MTDCLEVLVGIRDAPGADGEETPHYFFALAFGDQRLAYHTVPMTTAWWHAQQQGLPPIAQAMNRHGARYEIKDGLDMTSQGKRRSCDPLGKHRLQDVQLQLPLYLTRHLGA